VRFEVKTDKTIKTRGTCSEKSLNGCLNCLNVVSPGFEIYVKTANS